MSLIVRIDVDRPYGKHPGYRHVLSRLSSDFYFPRIESCGYLDELKWMLRVLNNKGARAYAFFRQCTLPSPSVLTLLQEGGHEVGLHLENSRSYETFLSEKQTLERYLGRPVLAVSKHGSGGGRYGRRHYAPYEPERYLEWAHRAGMKLFLGNLEDPTVAPQRNGGDLLAFPSAFWLEPHWRDTGTFTVDWLISHARRHDTVLLVHPENVLENPDLITSFTGLLDVLETKLLS